MKLRKEYEISRGREKLFLYKITLNYDKSDYEKYPFNIPAIKNIKELSFSQNVTFITGENGSGKSTLIEAIAIKMGFNPEGGSRFLRFSTQDSHSSLYTKLTLHKNHKHPENHFFLRSESFYNVASSIDEVDKYDSRGISVLPQYGGKSLHKQSHGESIFSLFMHKFGKNGFYILDEPETALSVSRQLAFLGRLHELVLSNCQFIIITHSPIILSYPNAVIYDFGDNGVGKVGYEETDVYSITKYFLNHYKKALVDIGIKGIEA